MYTLREGLQIQVLWDVTTLRGTTRRVWWDATVTKLHSGPRTSGLKGELLYNSDHGYDAASASVIFKDGCVLLAYSDLKTKPNAHRWRSAAALPTTSDAAEIDIAESPTWKQTDQASKATEPCEGSCAGCISLTNRIEKLEQAVVPTLSVYSGVLARLSVLRVKLGGQLDVPLCGQSERSLADRGSHRTTQDVLKVQADCNLAELQGLADLASRLLPNEAECTPFLAPGTHLRPRMPRLSIVFSSYYALCRLIGIESSEAIQDSLVRVRKKGKAGRIVATRVIGALFYEEKQPSLPLLISIGHNLRQHETHSVPIPVLSRRDTNWNDVDKLYEHELEARYLMPAEIRKECGLDTVISDGESDGPTPEKQNDEGLFSLTWTRLSKVADCGTFQHVEATEIHGTLEVTVPHVMFRGPFHGEEVAKVLSVAFMSKAVFK
jgi:hypothetical protein